MNEPDEKAPGLFEHRAILFLRAALVVIFLIFGLLKFTLLEAQGIAPLISNSPIASWLNIFGTQGASRVVGVSELLFGSMLAVAFWRPASIVAMLGGVGSVITFLTTLSFLVTTPGNFVAGQEPILSPIGEFLVKDIVLLAASCVLLAQSLAIRKRARIGY